MEVLLEYRGSRRQITVSGGESITECVTTELRRVGRSSASVYTADHNLQNTEERDVYLLQKWSPQWDCFVDIRNTNEIHDGDRLTVVPKPKPPSKIIRLLCCCCSTDEGREVSARKRGISKNEEIQALDYTFTVESETHSHISDWETRSLTPTQDKADDDMHYVRDDSGRASWKMVPKMSQDDDEQEGTPTVDNEETHSPGEELVADSAVDVEPSVVDEGHVEHDEGIEQSGELKDDEGHVEHDEGIEQSGELRDDEGHVEHDEGIEQSGELKDDEQPAVEDQSTGVTGEGGESGEPGESVEADVSGVSGEPGDPSVSGEPGEADLSAVTSDHGDPGMNGEGSESGVTGDGGASGVTGDGGASGVTGDGGASGVTGDGGESGVPGEGGESAEPSVTGEGGEPGDGGESGVPGEGGESAEPSVTGEGGEPGEGVESGVAGEGGESAESGVTGEGGDAGAPMDVQPEENFPEDIRDEKDDEGIAEVNSIPQPNNNEQDKSYDAPSVTTPPEQDSNNYQDQDGDPNNSVTE